jgi:outer membrane lipoprotein carrier protein
VTLYRLSVCLLAVSAFAADASLSRTLENVEKRYNKAKTLEVSFNETYKPVGRASSSESGVLKLRKPGKMRWDYTQPKGKLFVSDGKDLWLFTPSQNRVEKMKLKESDDMRAPLAFLLGKLDFSKEFRNIQTRPEGPNTRILAEPASDNLPYSAVEFVITPENRIVSVTVTGFDKSLLSFNFEGEKVDPQLSADLFKFKPPAGATVVESEQ